jgi:phage terminase large subunit-like protein
MPGDPSGDIDDPETMVVIYAPGEDDDWTKEETWRKANPNFGKSVKLDPFMADFKRARQLPRLENDFKRYRLNMWTDQAVAGCRSTRSMMRAGASAGTIASVRSRGMPRSLWSD